jgi:hypothetical protein
VTAFFWRIDDNIVHHVRAESSADVRARIAAIHGDDAAQRAVITVVGASVPTDPRTTAACA